MIEIPEAEGLAKQFNQTIAGKVVAQVIAGLSPHKFAWYHGNPKAYDALLRRKTIGTAITRGGMLEIEAGDAVFLFTDGVVLRFHAKNEQRPQ